MVSCYQFKLGDNGVIQIAASGHAIFIITLDYKRTIGVGCMYNVARKLHFITYCLGDIVIGADAIVVIIHLFQAIANGKQNGVTRLNSGMLMMITHIHKGTHLLGINARQGADKAGIGKTHPGLLISLCRKVHYQQ